jgi:hypothetical protein
VWQLLHDRIPTKRNLVIRQVIDSGQDSLCVCCGEEIEIAAHLFLYCRVALTMWKEIFAWLKVPFNLPRDLFSIFYCLLCIGDPKAHKGRLMICCTTVWLIWRFRNSALFENSRGTVSELVEAVKKASWKWWLARTKNSHCLFYEWRTDPSLWRTEEHSESWLVKFKKATKLCNAIV